MNFSYEVFTALRGDTNDTIQQSYLIWNVLDFRAVAAISKHGAMLS